MNEARHAVHEEAEALGGLDIEYNIPSSALGIAGPGVVGEDDFAAFGEASGGDEGGATFGYGDGGFFREGDVVGAEFEPGVEGDDVPEVEFKSAGDDAVGDALEFLAVLGFDFRPEDFFGSFAEEGPIFFRIVFEGGGDDAAGIADFGGEEIAVLESDRVGFAFEVDVNPTIFRRFPKRGAKSCVWSRRFGNLCDGGHAVPAIGQYYRR